MNYKNLLQEYLQKRGYSIPTYDGKVDILGWIGNVTININNKYLTFYGIECNNKKDSQQNASKKALECLYKYKEGIKYNCYKDTNILNLQDIIFIDIENVSKYNYIIPSKYIYGFISTNSCLYNKIEDIKQYMDVYVYDGNEKDGADILLSMIISKKIQYIKKYKNKVIILTNDHFGICIKKILEKNDISCDVIKSLK
jgi:hypothetical protein